MTHLNQIVPLSFFEMEFPEVQRFRESGVGFHLTSA